MMPFFGKGQGPSLQGYRLLLIDDSAYARHLAKQALEPLKPDALYEAASGQEGLELYVQYKPDLVLLDIVMEGKNGLETIQGLLALDPKARIIMLSAVDTKRTLNDCIKQGILDFVLKPYDPEELQEAVINSLQI